MKGSSRAILGLVAASITAACTPPRPAALPPLPPVPGREHFDPPAAVYLVVLDSVSARLRPVLAARRVFVDPAGLPAQVRPEDLRARGFAPMDSSYRCGHDAWISLAEPPQYENGRHQLATTEWLAPERSSMSMDHVYHVVCEGGACQVDASLLGLSDRVRACPVASPN